MKKIVSAVLVAGISVSLGGQALADKIGVVNYLDVFQAVPQGKATLQSMISEMQPKVATLKAQQKSLEDQENALERDAPTMSKAQRDAKEKALADQQEAFQKQVSDLRDKQMTDEKQAQENFEKALTSAVDKVAKKDSYDFIFASQALPYYNSKADVSDEVITAMKAAATSLATDSKKTK